METLSIKLEKALLDLRDAITLNQPSLLPLVHTLSEELRHERALAHQQKVRFLFRFNCFIILLNVTFVTCFFQVALVVKLSGHRQSSEKNSNSKTVASKNAPTTHKPAIGGSSGDRTNLSVSFANDGAISTTLPSRYASTSTTPSFSKSRGSRNSAGPGQFKSSSSQKGSMMQQTMQHQHQRFSNVQLQEDLGRTAGVHSQSHQQSSIIFAESHNSTDDSSMGSHNKSSAGKKPKMAFFRRLEA